MVAFVGSNGPPVARRITTREPTHSSRPAAFTTRRATVIPATACQLQTPLENAFGRLQRAGFAKKVLLTNTNLDNARYHHERDGDYPFASGSFGRLPNVWAWRG